MQASEAIALAAVIVSGVTTSLSLAVVPLTTRKVQRDQRVHDERLGIYAETLSLLRARVQELEEVSLGWPVHTQGPTGEQGESITSQLLIVGGDEVTAGVQRFFRHYWSTTSATLRIDGARAAGRDDIAARLEVGKVVDEMRVLSDRIADAMRVDLGLKAVYDERRVRTKREAGERAMEEMQRGPQLRYPTPSMATPDPDEAPGH